MSCCRRRGYRRLHRRSQNVQAMAIKTREASGVRLIYSPRHGLDLPAISRMTLIEHICLFLAIIAYTELTSSPQRSYTVNRGRCPLRTLCKSPCSNAFRFQPPRNPDD